MLLLLEEEVVVAVRVSNTIEVVVLEVVEEEVVELLVVVDVVVRDEVGIIEDDEEVGQKEVALHVEVVEVVEVRVPVPFPAGAACVLAVEKDRRRSRNDGTEGFIGLDLLRQTLLFPLLQVVGHNSQFVEMNTVALGANRSFSIRPVARCLMCSRVDSSDLWGGRRGVGEVCRTV